MKIRITEKQLMGIIKKNQISENLDELDYGSFQNDENLQDLRDAIDKNKMVSVAFVKKDGTVKHMLVRRTLSSYVGSEREKSDAQMNVEMNHNLKKVVDINAYKRELKSLREQNPEMEDSELKSMASKKAWRSINLTTVLGFMVGGRFIDLRDENQIMDRFGEEVHNSLTRSMVSAMQAQAQPVEEPEVVNPEPQMDAEQPDQLNEQVGRIRRMMGLNESTIRESFWNSVFGKPDVKDAASTQIKSQGYSHIGRDEERKEENYLVFNGEKFYPEQIEYADYQDLGDLPRVEDGKLIIANPAWNM